MSLNIIVNTDITETAKELLKLIAEEEKKSKDDMKKYLDKTNLSAEEKTKTYSQFSGELFSAKLGVINNAVNIVVQDKQLDLQSKQNVAQIKFIEAQEKVQIQEELIARENVAIAKERLNLARQELDLNKSKMFLENAKAIVNFDNVVATTLSEARKNGAEITKSNMTYTCPITQQVIGFEHISLAAALSTDTTKGLMGYQMKQLDKQAKSFDNHDLVQIGNQVMQLSSSAISEGLTSITGLLTTHKNIVEKIEAGITSGTYTTIS